MGDAYRGNRVKTRSLDYSSYGASRGVIQKGWGWEAPYAVELPKGTTARLQ